MTHTKDEALNLALEALETGWSPTYTGRDAKEMGMKAITVIKQALAAPTLQEPVAWTPGSNLFKDWCSQYFGPDADDAYIADAIFNLPPMAQRFAVTPPAAPTVQEPVATVIEELEHDGEGFCAKVRWLYNPVPLGETLSWEQPK
jgi:hypothetical protein